MKTVSVRELQKSIRSCVDAAQAGRVVITRNGEPVGVLVGVEGLDWETVVLASDAAFWALMEERRKEPALLTIAELRRRLKQPPPSRRRSAR